MNGDLNFDAKPPPRCKLCGKQKGNHKAGNFACPVGMKTRAGFTQFHASQTYQSK